MYNYKKFTSYDKNGKPVSVGQALVDFLNSNPKIKVVKIDFTDGGKDTYSNYNPTVAHLVYIDD